MTYTIKDCTFKNCGGHDIDCTSVPTPPRRRLKVGSNFYWAIVTLALAAWCIFRM